MVTMHNLQRWHSAIGMTHLNDTDSRGPLTEADMPSAPRIPRQRSVSLPGLALLGGLAAGVAIVIGLVLSAIFP